jgi:hypothetical protein
MNGWQLVILLGTLCNTVCLILWQRANETRLDILSERLRQQQETVTGLAPVLRVVSAQLAKWEAARAESKKGNV